MVIHLVIHYTDQSDTWTYTGKVPGTFNTPLFLTIDGQCLAVRSSGDTQKPQTGYVTVIDLSGTTSTVTITDRLQHRSERRLHRVAADGESHAAP